jgi:hypothetical protein
MKKEEIIKMIKDLQKIYLKHMEKGNWSMGVDTHDEIRRWTEDLKRFKK